MIIRIIEVKILIIFIIKKIFTNLKKKFKLVTDSVTDSVTIHQRPTK